MTCVLVSCLIYLLSEKHHDKTVRFGRNLAATYQSRRIFTIIVRQMTNLSVLPIKVIFIFRGHSFRMLLTNFWQVWWWGWRCDGASSLVEFEVYALIWDKYFTGILILKAKVHCTAFETCPLKMMVEAHHWQLNIGYSRCMKINISKYKIIYFAVAFIIIIFIYSLKFL